MSNDGEQRQVKQVSATALGARGARCCRAHTSAIVSAHGRNVGELDAVLAIVPLPATAAAFRSLPERARWRELDACTGARRDRAYTALSNHRQTLAVLGYLKSDASAFERLSSPGAC